MDDFICQCEERFRSACVQLPSYAEWDGKRYCALHFPSKEKEADRRFQEALRGKLEDRDFDFAGVYFPGYLKDFTSVEFDSKADFSGATFEWGATFAGATFEEEADFSGATFQEGTSFSGITFEKGARFFGAAFEEGVVFSQATLEEVDLSGVTFEGGSKVFRI